MPSRHSEGSLSALSSKMSETSRVAIVTGSGQGIGRAIAVRLAKDGYDVALFDLPSNEAQLETVKTEISKEHATKAISVLGDVTKEKDVESLVAETVQKLGSLDAVRVNNTVQNHVSQFVKSFRSGRWWPTQE